MTEITTSTAKMSFILFSATADKLQAAATMISGAAAMDVETHVFITFWGLNAFRKDSITQPLPMPKEYGEMAEMMGKLMVEKGVDPWYELLRMAKDMGNVHVHACAMTADLLGLTKDDFDPMVEDVIGVGTFVQIAEGGSIVFI
ncbi:MAG: DsrE/DsrF/DrsH-like family protein [Actinobacteria bacterium]|nr:DsrE/DsrF/DrsH-like family protein [Actinomycetota bacterium]